MWELIRTPRFAVPMVRPRSSNFGCFQTCYEVSAREPCQQALSQGTGETVLSRWYFNQNTLQCVSFTYRGLKGNQNNFLSRKDCENTCPGQNFLHAVCFGKQARYVLFLVFENPCVGGDPAMSPNGRRPLQCSRGGSPCPRLFWCHIGADAESSVCCPGGMANLLSSVCLLANGSLAADPCTQAMTQGLGQSNLPRWYYNAMSRQCIQFTYRGLMGNQNSFLSQRQCEEACPGLLNHERRSKGSLELFLRKV